MGISNELDIYGVVKAVDILKRKQTEGIRVAIADAILNGDNLAAAT